MNKFAKLLMVSTSFAPIIFTYAFVKYLNSANILSLLTYLIIIVLLVAICLLLIKYAKNEMETFNFTINSLKTADGEVVGFIVAYLIPILSLTNPNIDNRIIWFIGAMFFIVIWTTNSYHINPLLTLIGYHFYEITTNDNVTYLLLTKKDLKKTKDISTIVHLTEYMILDVEGKNV